MERSSEIETDLSFDPLDMVETILAEESLDYERTQDGDIVFSLSGGWKAYEMWFSFHAQGECLQLCCALGFEGLDTLDGARKGALFELLCMINQRVWFGHFEIYQEDLSGQNRPGFDHLKGADIVFRHALAVTLIERPSMIQMAHMINRVAEAVDSFYPAFDFWYQGLKSPQQAIEACLFETVGEA